jgi:hypothetical protein
MASECCSGKIPGPGSRSPVSSEEDSSALHYNTDGRIKKMSIVVASPKSKITLACTTYIAGGDDAAVRSRQ